jgi:FkbH-like protein
MDQLAWLPVHDDLGAALRDARAERDLRRRLRKLADLANHRRDFVATEKLGRYLSECLRQDGAEAATSEARLSPCRLAILASHSVDHLVPAIRVAGLGRRLALTTYVAPYGQYRQALLAGDPTLGEFAPQFLLLALDSQDARLDVPLDGSDADVEAAVEARIEELRGLWRIARQGHGAQVIQQTMVPAEPPLFGSFDGLVPGAPAAVVERLNAALRRAARQDNVLLLDLAWQAHRFSPGAIADPVRWHQAKQLIAPHAAPLYGDLVARTIAAGRGLSRKCLVLDLDNTLWGGVVGDDGVEGLRLGQGDPLGEAFLAFQRYVAALGRRGTVLAVCSKNDEAVAKAAFSEHPEMVLRLSDFACFIANWEDKAANLRRLARELNLGLDSLVFVDDNPAERDIIRRELPAIAVPELPEDVALYPACLADSGYFEAAAFTSDDAMRNRSYRENAERQTMLEQATDMEGYLKGLSMILVASEIRPADLPRAAQLINKSNQFNLTTRRYSEAELEKLVANPNVVAMCFRLRDRFGDNGLISVILSRPDDHVADNALLIDTWLMSCRVLGRQVEAAALEVVAEEAKRRGIRALIGEYRPTSRNGLVSHHYEKLGFVPARLDGAAAEQSEFWRFDIGDQAAPRHFIRVERIQ